MDVVISVGDVDVYRQQIVCYACKFSVCLDSGDCEPTSLERPGMGGHEFNSGSFTCDWRRANATVH
jgi:hypothetical protein